MFTLRDELLAVLPGPDSELVASRAVLFEEFLAAESKAGRLDLELKPAAKPRALLHGHCHQKAFGTFDATLALLSSLPDVKVSAIESSCCGMAGSFGYELGHYEASMAMAELALLPAVRSAPEALIVAAGTSCRNQIADGARREAVHPLAALALHL